LLEVTGMPSIIDTSGRRTTDKLTSPRRPLALAQMSRSNLSASSLACICNKYEHSAWASTDMEGSNISQDAKSDEHAADMHELC
jgi:hypothetical protein